MRTRVLVIVALAVAVGLATAVSPFASSNPDGLEKVAQSKRFLDAAKPHAIQDSSPVPGYAFPGVGNERVATGLAGFAGTLAVFALGYGMAFALRRRPARGQPRRAPA